MGSQAYYVAAVRPIPRAEPGRRSRIDSRTRLVLFAREPKADHRFRGEGAASISIELALS